MVLTPKQRQRVDNGDYGFGSKKSPSELWPNAVVPYEMSREIG